MKALFIISSDQFIINDFKPSDIEFLIRLREVKNKWRKEFEPLEQGPYFNSLEILEDNDTKIMGKNGDEKQIEDIIKDLTDASNTRLKWFQDEKEKVKKLTEELNKLKEVSNGN